MAARKKGNRLGSWAFLIGVILAIIFGVVSSAGNGMSAWVTYLLVVLGIIIGLLNIADEEASPFLMAGTVLVIVSVLGQGVVSLVPVFSSTLQALTVLFVPATIIVALKHVFSLARN